MAEKTFNEAIKEFRNASRQGGLSDLVIERNVAVITAPITSGEAIGTAFRWFNAPIGDPIHERPLKDIADLFAKASSDWEKSLQAADEIWDIATSPDNIEQVTDVSRGFNWSDWRARLLDEVDPTHPLANHIQATTDGFVRLAKKGLVREALTEPIRQLGKISRDNSTIYSDLTQSGVAGLAKRRRRDWDEYDEGWTDGMCLGAGLMGVAAFAGVAGAAAATGGLACAVMAGYGLGKFIRRDW